MTSLILSVENQTDFHNKYTEMISSKCWTFLSYISANTRFSNEPQLGPTANCLTFVLYKKQNLKEHAERISSLLTFQITVLVTSIILGMFCHSRTHIAFVWNIQDKWLNIKEIFECDIDIHIDKLKQKPITNILMSTFHGVVNFFFDLWVWMSFWFLSPFFSCGQLAISQQLSSLSWIAWFK